MSLRTRAIGIVAGGVMAVAIPFVAVHEGYVPRAYLDPVGVPTICYGHTKNVVLGQRLTKRECDALLALDLEEAFIAVDRHVKVPIRDETRIALASFTFNVGEGNLARSTLLRKLNAGDIAGACRELPRWIYARGRQLPGLVKRRQAEMELCLKGVK